jgi:hypothetical protein
MTSARWAGRSVWYDRSVGIAEAAGSNPAPSTKMCSCGDSMKVSFAQAIKTELKDVVKGDTNCSKAEI